MKLYEWLHIIHRLWLQTCIIVDAIKNIFISLMFILNCCRGSVVGKRVAHDNKTKEYTGRYDIIAYIPGEIKDTSVFDVSNLHVSIYIIQSRCLSVLVTVTVR